MNYYKEEDCINLVLYENYYCVVPRESLMICEHKKLFDNSKLFSIYNNVVGFDGIMFNAYMPKNCRFNYDLFCICIFDDYNSLIQFEQQIGHKL